MLIHTNSSIPPSFAFFYPTMSIARTLNSLRQKLSIPATKRTITALRHESLKPTTPPENNPYKQIFILCNEGRLKEAIESLFPITQSGFPITYSAYSCVLHECVRSRSLEYGIRVHTHMIETGFSPDLFTNNDLIRMYVKLGCLSRALQVFEEMPHRDVVSWSTIISGLASCGQEKEALNCFKQMLNTDNSPNQFTFSAVLRACLFGYLLTEGEEVHGLTIKVGALQNLWVENSLIDMYGRFGKTDFARQVFDQMLDRDVISWNTMISAYINGYGSGEEGLDLFNRMRKFGFTPSNITFVNLVRVAGTCLSLIMGKQIHVQIIKQGFDADMFVGNSLITMYSSAGSLDCANEVFENLSERDEVVWTGMIGKFAANGHLLEALKLFCEMRRENIVVDHVAVATVLSSFDCLDCLQQGKQVHTFLIKNGLEPITFVINAVVTMYARCGSISDARKVFALIPEVDRVSWNAMISGYVQVQSNEEALLLFNQMNRSGIGFNHISFTSALGACTGFENLELGKTVHALVVKTGFEWNSFVGNALVAMYAVLGRLEFAEKVFENLDCRDVVSWNSLITGFYENGLPERAVILFETMHRASVAPTNVTFIGVLSACAELASLNQGKQVAACVSKSGFCSKTSVGNTLLTMYAKCGRIDDAERVFYAMVDRDIVSWNALITRYAQHGMASNALHLFEQMQNVGLQPDSITFVGVLSACSHVGLVEEGRCYFESMNRDYGIDPGSDHYACMVDLFGRVGYLNKAIDLIETMPIPPSGLVWRTLLGACRKHENTVLGQFAAEKLMELEPEDSAGYALLSTIYALDGRWEENAKLRKAMKNKNLTIKPGVSWIEVNRRVHIFQMEDRFHPSIREIYAKLEELMEQIEQMGYVRDISFVLHDVEEKHKQISLAFHSEKLAIAYGLISTPCSIPITIMKNLRVCGDCHIAIKFFSKAVEREIILRDSHRFHHFKEGLCSCGDYW